MDNLNEQLNSVIILLNKLSFKDISKNDTIKFHKAYESNTYHRHDLIIYQTPLFELQIIYVHSGGYGLENRSEYKFNNSTDKGILKLIELLKENFEKELRVLKIKDLLC